MSLQNFRLQFSKLITKILTIKNKWHFPWCHSLTIWTLKNFPHRLWTKTQTLTDSIEKFNSKFQKSAHTYDMDSKPFSDINTNAQNRSSSHHTSKHQCPNKRTAKTQPIDHTLAKDRISEYPTDENGRYAPGGRVDNNLLCSAGVRLRRGSDDDCRLLGGRRESAHRSSTWCRCLPCWCCCCEESVSEIEKRRCVKLSMLHLGCAAISKGLFSVHRFIKSACDFVFFSNWLVFFLYSVFFVWSFLLKLLLGDIFLVYFYWKLT